MATRSLADIAWRRSARLIRFTVDIAPLEDNKAKIEIQAHQKGTWEGDGGRLNMHIP